MVPILAALILAVSPVDADAPKRSADQDALKPFAGLVGEWKGTGQPQRGSARGSWTESADWSWSLSKEHAALAVAMTKGKYLKSAILRPGPKSGTYRLEATLTDGSSRSFAGEVGARNALVLLPETPVEDGLARLTLTPLHDTRFLLLLEARAGEKFSRLGEVGYTRQGVAFAAGDSSPPCIVTGGKGTIPVTYKGATYKVCCSGCKDLFNDDPEGVLAEYARKKKDAAK